MLQDDEACRDQAGKVVLPVPEAIDYIKAAGLSLTRLADIRTVDAGFAVLGRVGHWQWTKVRYVKPGEVAGADWITNRMKIADLMQAKPTAFRWLRRSRT